MSKENKKKLREIVEIDLSNLPVEETKLFLKLLAKYSEAPSESLAPELINAFLSIAAKLGLLPTIRKEAAKRHPPDEPRRKHKSRKGDEE